MLNILYMLSQKNKWWRV